MRRLGLLAVLLALAAPAAAAAPLPRFAGCLMKRTVVRPQSILVACGDANFYLSRLHWTRWNATEARATGVGTLNDCKPYCAAGHFHTYAVAVHLFRPAACTGGVREFTRFAYTFIGAGPAVKPPAGVEKSPFYTGAGCR